MFKLFLAIIPQWIGDNNYLHSIYFVLGYISGLEIIKHTTEVTFNDYVILYMDLNTRGGVPEPLHRYKWMTTPDFIKTKGTILTE